MRKKHRRPSKRRNDIYHTRKRASQRAGLKLSKQDVLTIGKMIRNGNGRFIEKQTNTRSLFAVNYNDKDLAIVYSTSTNTPVTAMPLRWIEKEQAMAKKEIICTAKNK